MQPPATDRTDSGQRNSEDAPAAPRAPARLARRPLLRAVGAAGALGLAAPLASRPARADHETDPCAVTIDFNRAHVARVFDVATAGLTSLTVFYFDRDGTAQKRDGIDPTTNAEYGDPPLRVRYDGDADRTTIQIGGPNAALRRVVAFGPDCRSAETNPLDSAAGDDEEPTADFTWEPDPVIADQPATFTSTATDPDGELIHHGWDFDVDGTEDAAGEAVTHTFPTRGDHAVTHTVVDDFDATDSVTRTVPVRWEQVAKLAAGDGDGDDRFGVSTAVDGDTAVVGAYWDEDPNGTKAGSAYVFTRDGGSWSQQAKLVAEDGERVDLFGVSVAVDGDTALVGAHQHDPGTVYVFTRSGGSWSQQAELVAEDDPAFDEFGLPVALDGDTALVGNRADEDPTGTEAGAAYVFTRDGGSWSQQAKLVADDRDANDFFGEAVAVNGDTALVGAPVDSEPNGAAAGAAYVFTRDGGSWSQQAKLAASDGDERDLFGNTVALDGDTALVGAHRDEDPNGDEAGAAYVFTRDGGSWSQQAKLGAGDGDGGDRFGVSVAVDGDTAVVGAFEDEDPNGSEAGSAYVFRRSGESWSQQAKLGASDGDGGDRFGVSVAVGGDTAVVGAFEDEDPNGSEAGSAYVFRE